MDNTVLEMLGKLQEAAQQDQLKQQFRHHAEETEHHEIAAYEGLITGAEAMGKPDIVRLLEQNLEQERHTLEEIKQATQQPAQRQFAQAA
jgi:ferritin-like metal-binding protein YciE